MARDRATKPPPLHEPAVGVRIDCTLMGVKPYPNPAEVSLDPVVSYVCHDIVPDQLVDEPLQSLACFLTRDPVSSLWSNVDSRALQDSEGFVCCIRDVAEDALFYFAAALRADGFVYVFGRKSLHEELIYGIWDRVAGLGAFVNRNGRALTRLPSAAARGILPPTIAAGDRDVDIVH